MKLSFKLIKIEDPNDFINIFFLVHHPFCFDFYPSFLLTFSFNVTAPQNQVSISLFNILGIPTLHCTEHCIEQIDELPLHEFI